MNKFKITFLGAAGSVTGSCTLIEFNDEKFFVDCGIVQGEKNIEKAAEKSKEKILELVPKVRGVFVTHAHLDHIGLLPEMIERGFVGLVYCTKATKDLIPIMLRDAMKLSGKYKVDTNKGIDEIGDILKKIRYFAFDEREDFVWGKKFFPITRDLFVNILRSGHILGSVSYQFSANLDSEKKEEKPDKSSFTQIHFSGDLGSDDEIHQNNNLAKSHKVPYFCEQMKYIVMESTYGNRVRNKENVFESRIERLHSIIEETFKKKGKVLIAAFSLHRSQEILFDLEEIMQKYGEKRKYEKTIDSFCNNTLASLVSSEKLDMSKIREILTQSGFNHNKKLNRPNSTTPIKFKELSEEAKNKIFELIKESHNLDENGEIFEPFEFNVRIESPLILTLNDVYKRHLTDSFMDYKSQIKTKYIPRNLFSRFSIEPNSDSDSPDNFKDKIKQLRDVFDKVLQSSKKSENNKSANSKGEVIVSSSGMCDEGMIMKILPKFLKEPTNTLVLTGYQAEGTNGYILKHLEGYKDDLQYLYNHFLNGTDLRLCEIKCKIFDLAEFYSGHADAEQLAAYVHGNRGEKMVENTFPTTVFLNHGTDESRAELKKRLEDMNKELEHKISVVLPDCGDSFIIE